MTEIKNERILLTGLLVVALLFVGVLAIEVTADSVEPDEETKSCGPSLFYHTEAIQGSSLLNLVFTGTGYMQGSTEDGTTPLIDDDTIWDDPTDAPWYDIMGYIGKITFSLNMKSVSPYAFWGCDNVESLIIPGGIEVIDSTALVMENLLAVQVDSSNTHLYIDRGVLIYASVSNSETALRTDTSQDVKVIWAPRVGLGDEVLVPINTTEVAPYAYYKNSDLKILVFSDRVTKIGKSAFEGSSLTTVATTDWITTIGDRAFAGTPVTMAYVGPNVTSLELSAFDDCPQLQVVAIASDMSSSGVTYSTIETEDAKKFISTENRWMPSWHVAGENGVPSTVEGTGQAAIFDSYSDIVYNDIILIKYDPETVPGTPAWDVTYDSETGAFNSNKNINVGIVDINTSSYKGCLVIQTGEKPYDTVLFAGRDMGSGLPDGWLNSSGGKPLWLLTPWDFGDFADTEGNRSNLITYHVSISENSQHGMTIFGKGLLNQDRTTRLFFSKQVQYPSNWTSLRDQCFTYVCGKFIYIPADVNYSGNFAPWTNNYSNEFVISYKTDGTSNFRLVDSCLVKGNKLCMAPGEKSTIILDETITSIGYCSIRGGQYQTIYTVNDVNFEYEGSATQMMKIKNGNIGLANQGGAYTSDVWGIYGKVTSMFTYSQCNVDLIIYDAMGATGSISLKRGNVTEYPDGSHWANFVVDNPDYGIDAYVNLYTGDVIGTDLSEGLYIKQSKYSEPVKIYDGSTYTGVMWLIVDDTLVFVYDRTQTSDPVGYIPDYNPGVTTPWTSYINSKGWQSRITGIYVDEHITSVGDYAFSGLSSVTSIVLPDSAERIGKGALDDLSIEVLMIPRSVAVLGSEGGTELSVPSLEDKNLRAVSVRSSNSTFCSDSNVLYTGTTALLCPDGYDGSVAI